MLEAAGAVAGRARPVDVMRSRSAVVAVAAVDDDTIAAAGAVGDATAAAAPAAASNASSNAVMAVVALGLHIEGNADSMCLCEWGSGLMEGHTLKSTIMLQLLPRAQIQGYRMCVNEVGRGIESKHGVLF